MLSVKYTTECTVTFMCMQHALDCSDVFQVMIPYHLSIPKMSSLSEDRLKKTSQLGLSFSSLRKLASKFLRLNN